MSEVVRVQASRRYRTNSPLRYPGGKASLAGFFEDLIGALGLKGATYVEPYAGGAGAGIALLKRGIVEHLVLNDIDPAVHAFWSSVMRRNDEFVEMVETAPLTVDEWQTQRGIYRASDASDPLQLGFAFFYLNRTNRSGVLNAGVIGGQAQTGNYKIDARFNRAVLSERIRALGDLSDQIQISDLDGRTLIQEYSADSNTFMYIDPPYVKAGSRLYLNAFDGRDHIALSEVVKTIKSAHWVMTYDLAPLVQKLYASHFQARLDLTYSVQNSGKAEELLVASDTVAGTIKALHETLTSVGA